MIPFVFDYGLALVEGELVLLVMLLLKTSGTSGFRVD